MITSNNSSPEIKSLLQNISRGDQVSFKKLYNLYYSHVYSYSLTYLRSDSLAKDCVQDVFLKIWEKRSELSDINDFKPWLFRVVKNYLLNTLKKAASEKNIREEIISTFPINYEEIIETEMISETDRKITRIKKLISELPEQRQKVFTLCRIEEKSYIEVAEQLNISKSTVNDHMVKAMKHLRKALLLIFC